MARIPARFKRVAAVFNEVSRVNYKLCESSGSEHSPAESLTDLSDLVNSFIERETRVGEENYDKDEAEEGIFNEEETDVCSGNNGTKDTLRGLFMGLVDDDDDVRQEIYSEVERACAGEVANGSNLSPAGFKRRLMTRLRDRGFDAGLCKSKWEKNGRIPPGSYEYMDVYVDRTRYIIEVSLSAEFEIARPTNCYSSLLEEFPQIFVGKLEELKQIVRLMSNAIKMSMKRMEIHVPPWRRHGYMQAKWFGSYKRTINEVPLKGVAFSSNEDLARKRALGFSPLTYFCREEFASKVGNKVGNLAAVLNQPTLPL